MEPFETYEHAGVTVELHYDEMGCNPRTEFDSLGVIASWSRFENFGEENWSREYGEPYAESIPQLRRELDAGTVVPVRFEDYGSSGARIYDVQDLAHANGVIYCTREKQREEGLSHQRVRKALLGELGEYDSYLQGEVYGYIAGRDTPFEDSCWGFIGNDKYVREEANAAAESVAERLERERVERCNAACRDIVTV